MINLVPSIETILEETEGEGSATTSILENNAAAQ